jgi:hypothetical protein
MVFDPATAVQDAAIAALDVPALTGLGAEVWAHPPEVGPEDDPLADTAWVVVGDVGLAPEGGKDGGLDRATLTVTVLIRKPGRSHLSALQAVVRDQLENQPFVVDGAILMQPVQVSADGQLQEDGATYIGTQRFETLVQADA